MHRTRAVNRDWTVKCSLCYECKILISRQYVVTGLSIGKTVVTGRDTRPVPATVWSKKKRVVLRQRWDYSACVKMPVKQCCWKTLTVKLRVVRVRRRVCTVIFGHTVRCVRLTSIASLPLSKINKLFDSGPRNTWIALHGQLKSRALRLFMCARVRMCITLRWNYLKTLFHT